MKRLAIVCSHPIQYYAPWFQFLAKQNNLHIKLFYLWDFGVTKKEDADFKIPIEWDISLVEGYEYEFVPNISKYPGTHHFRGLNNPSLFDRVVSYSPDAVLLFGYNFLTHLSFLWQWRRKKVPLIFRGDSHRLLYNQGPKEMLKRWAITFLFKQFSAFLYAGKSNHDYFLYHGVAQKKLFYAPHAVDNERFFTNNVDLEKKAQLWRKELGIPQEDTVILFAGKFIEKKRPLDLLHAFLKIGIEKKALLFVGAGPLYEKLKNESAGHKNVYFSDFQNQSMMPCVYKAADLIVLPSYGLRETWGLCINEAMCLARAVIVSSHVGCARDLVTPYHNGLIFKAGDVEDLARCLQEALNDKARLKEWGKMGQQIIENYNYEVMTEGLFKALSCLKIL